MVKPALLYPLAAVAEIAGCYAFWGWLRLDRPAWWLVPGVAALIVFATALAFSPADDAGRAFAAYGGVYIAASLGWLWLVEGVRPDRWDMAGSGLCLLGALVICHVGHKPSKFRLEIADSASVRSNDVRFFVVSCHFLNRIIIGKLLGQSPSRILPVLRPPKSIPHPRIGIRTQKAKVASELLAGVHRSGHSLWSRLS